MSKVRSDNSLKTPLRRPDTLTHPFWNSLQSRSAKDASVTYTSVRVPMENPQPHMICVSFVGCNLSCSDPQHVCIMSASPTRELEMLPITFGEVGCFFWFDTLVQLTLQQFIDQRDQRAEFQRHAHSHRFRCSQRLRPRWSRQL